jgi:DNA-directed RNA polymerase subunit RPC12/RpoP
MSDKNLTSDQIEVFETRLKDGSARCEGCHTADFSMGAALDESGIYCPKCHYKLIVKPSSEAGSFSPLYMAMTFIVLAIAYFIISPVVTNLLTGLSIIQ